MYISKILGNYIGKTNDSLNILEYFQISNKREFFSLSLSISVGGGSMSSCFFLNL